jgi:N-acetylglucosamine repressor
MKKQDSIHDVSLPRASRRVSVLRLVRERSEISRSDIAAHLSLDKKTVSHLVDELLEQSLIASAGFKDSKAGRRQELLALNGGHSNYIGIDLGGTHIIGIRADLNGRILDRVFFEIRPGLPVDIILDQMKTICAALMKSTNRTADVRAFGICAPGFMNPSTGASIVAENIPGWKNVKLREIFEQEFALPVVTEDSSRAYALAELRLGEGRGKKDFLLIDLGYGIGMALVIGDQVYSGAGNKAGEIGHNVAIADGHQCACGNRGCLETVASGRAIARDGALGIQEGKSELLKGLTHGKADSVTAQDVAMAASMEDAFSIGILQNAGRYVGIALANAVSLLNPSLVFLGGGLIASNRIMEASIKDALGNHAMPGLLEDMEIRVSKLGMDGSALGSVCLATDSLFQEEANQ